MNLSQFALVFVIILIAGGVITLAVRDGDAKAEQAIQCVANGGKPMRIEGTTYCLNAQLFVPQ